MNVFNQRALLSAAAVLVLGGTPVLPQSANDGTDNSLAALTAEVRQLRVAIEESTRSQTQTQALAVYLSAQQSRMVQVSGQLDSARKELDAATLRSREIASLLERMQAQLLQETDPAKRTQMQDTAQALKADQARVNSEEQQARSRESELRQALERDQLRWNDLISMLEQLIRR